MRPHQYPKSLWAFEMRKLLDAIVHTIQHNMHLDDNILKDIEIYAFAGKMGSGKNFIAEKVFSKMMEPKPTVFLCFADQIKIDGIYKKGLDRNKCWIKKDEKTRRTLQTVGTEEGRDVYGKEIWISNLREWMIMHAYRGIQRIIVTDMRFANEFDFIKSIDGTCIMVSAPQRNSDALDREATEEDGQINAEKRAILAAHSSETDFDDGKREFDYTINNDYGQETSSVVECRSMVRNIIEEQRDDLVVFVDLDNTICRCNEYYTQQANSVKSLIKTYLEEKIPDAVMDKMFADFVNKHNGRHFHNHFYLNSFAFSLDMVVQDFRPFMTEMSDDDFEDIRSTVRQMGRAVFDYPYEALPGAKEGLEKLSEIARVVIYTMGDRQEQVKKLASLGLTDYDFEIYDFKDETIYRNLKHRYPAKTYAMIGDSFSRDIEPAVAVGMVGYHIQDKTQGYWYMGAEGNEDVNYVTVDGLLEAANRIALKIIRV